MCFGGLKLEKCEELVHCLWITDLIVIGLIYRGRLHLMRNLGDCSLGS